MLAPDGKKRKTQAADIEGIFRIIQSILSKKAEPAKDVFLHVNNFHITKRIRKLPRGIMGSVLLITFEVSVLRNHGVGSTDHF